MSEQIKATIKRWRALQGARPLWNTHWDDLARVFHPRRLGFASQPIDGAKRTENLYDGTPMQAARGLGNAIGGLLRPDGQTWAQIKTVDDALGNTDEAKDWLAMAQETLADSLLDPKARFRQATGEVDLDLVVFGTGILFAGEHPNLGRLLHQSVHLKDAVVVFSEPGDPEGAFISRMLTLRQAEARFGREKLSEASRTKLADGKMDDRIEVLRAVLPRKEGRADAMLARNLPYSDQWIEVEAAHEIAVQGFHEFPFIVPRFDTSSGEDYGRSPGMIALPDANTLQAMGETLLIAGQRAADPPLAVPNDGMIDAPNTFPGGLAYYDIDLAKEFGHIPIQALETGAKIPLTREMQMDMREQVWAAFFRNVLNLPVGGPQMTATEIMQRKEEFIREIGPVFGRLETDYTAPMIERDFKIMLRAGAFGPIPEALQGRQIRFEYESPVKRIRQQIEAAAARMWVAEHIEAANVTGRPEILDPIDFDEYTRFSAEAAALPHRLVRGREQVAQIRAQRAEQAQVQAEMAAATQLADAANKGASAVRQLAPPQTRAA